MPLNLNIFRSLQTVGRWMKTEHILIFCSSQFSKCVHFTHTHKRSIPNDLHSYLNSRKVPTQRMPCPMILKQANILVTECENGRRQINWQKLRMRSMFMFKSHSSSRNSIKMQILFMIFGWNVASFLPYISRAHLMHIDDFLAYISHIIITKIKPR